MEKLEDRYLNEHEVARITGRSVSTLRNDRGLHGGFPYVKIGRSVRYSLRDVMDRIEVRRVDPERVQRAEAGGVANKVITWQMLKREAAAHMDELLFTDKTDFEGYYVSHRLFHQTS